MKINDLILDRAIPGRASSPEMNPLTEEDALQEAQLLDLRFDVLTGVMGVLFELRQALQLREANTGVLVIRRIREFTWSSSGSDGALTAWSVLSSRPQSKDRHFGLSIATWPDASFTLTAENASFFMGAVPGLSEAPPDYGGSDRAMIDRQVARWDSSFELLCAVHVGLQQVS
jgi:hypothetical protein